jgi:hypothetical protein
MKLLVYLGTVVFASIFAYAMNTLSWPTLLLEVVTGFAFIYLIWPKEGNIYPTLSEEIDKGLTKIRDGVYTSDTVPHRVDDERIRIILEGATSIKEPPYGVHWCVTGTKIRTYPIVLCSCCPGTGKDSVDYHTLETARKLLNEQDESVWRIVLREVGLPEDTPEPAAAIMKLVDDLNEQISNQNK